MAIAMALAVAASVVSAVCGLRVDVPSHHPKGAVVASLTLLADEAPVRRAATHKDNRQRFLHDLLVLRCSALALGLDDVPFHLLYGGGVKDWELSMLKDVGWTIEDHRADLPFLKSIYRQNMSGGSTRIKSLWVTYMKFLAWRMTQYETVLHMDAECCFKGGPLALTAEFFNRPAGFKFLASDDKAGLHPENTNSHAMLLKPSMATFEDIVEEARTGNHTGRTNTEQDILEKMFPALQYSRPKIDQVLGHIHGCKKDHLCMERVLGENPQDLRKKARGVILGRRVTRDAGQMCAAIQQCVPEGALHTGAKRATA
mmetsp:Transcript_77663/g.240649  ORF Transcript_77663/g.240649 Transcript_77663/m.240649 type:complete len:314 (+) Transcript_77663:53-994(+)